MRQAGHQGLHAVLAAAVQHRQEVDAKGPRRLPRAPHLPRRPPPSPRDLLLEEAGITYCLTNTESLVRETTKIARLLWVGVRVSTSYSPLDLSLRKLRCNVVELMACTSVFDSLAGR